MFQRILAWSPYIELFVKRLYRSRIGEIFSKWTSAHKLSTNNSNKFDFEKIVSALKSKGIKDGDILIVHSSYDSLKHCRKSPDYIIDSLYGLVGKGGTLVMPVIRKYPIDNDGNMDMVEYPTIYNVKKSPVWTGALPFLMMRRKEASISKVPLNTLTALGAEAETMFENELLEDNSSPNGKNSPWDYCLRKNAWVVSIGVDMAHSLTMIHTTEDLLASQWPVKDWYRRRLFRIESEEGVTEKIFLERKRKWGTLHFAERTLAKDILKNKVSERFSVEGIQLEMLRSQDLHRFLMSRNQQGYPYFCVRANLK